MKLGDRPFTYGEYKEVYDKEEADELFTELENVIVECVKVLKKLKDEQVDLDPEIVDIVNDNFWDLF